MIPLVIVGAGGFGREVLELVADVNAARETFDVRGFLDDGEFDGQALERLRAPLLGTTSLLGELDAQYVIAIGTPDPRRRIDVLARRFGRIPATLVHPTATVGRDVQLGEGVIVAAGSRLTTNVALGRHSQVNVNCTVGHDAAIGDFATLYAGVHLGGGVTIGEEATLGTGCVVLPYVRVGRGAVVGAGAVAVHDVAPDNTVVGPSARPTLRRGEPA